MSAEFLDVQIQLYPELLRRMASGEKLASAEDKEDAEKIASTLLVAEAIENEQAAEAASAPAPIKKEGIALTTALLAGLAMPHVVKGVKSMRGIPAVPESVEQLSKSFRTILEERAATEAAKRKAVGAAVGGAAVGALATKAVENKKHEAVDEAVRTERRREKSSSDETVVAPAKVADEAIDARALLDKILKNFV